MLSLHHLSLSFGSFHTDSGASDGDTPDKVEPRCLGLKATNFVPYFDYEGDLTVSGAVTVYPELGHDKSGMVISGDLAGLDPLCNNGPDMSDGASPNSCGVHIHSGSSCTEDALGHFYNTAEDPWSAGYYMLNEDGHADVEFALMPETSSAEIMGKAVIVHDYSGGRIGCALLAMPMADQVVSPFSKYFSSEVVLSEFGKMHSAATIYTMPEVTYVSYQIGDVDPGCATGVDLAQSANSCGIHIHSGTSCDSDAFGHFYLPEDGADPWGAGFYTAIVEPEGVYATGEFTVSMAGLSQADVTGKVLIVHNIAGERTHCAPIHAPMGFLGVGAFSPYPRYEGMLAVAGAVKMTYIPNAAYGNAVYVDAVIVGGDPRCKDGSDAANGCGVHIHSGYDCDDADTIGDHLYGGDADPWGSVVYEVHGDGVASTGELVMVGMEWDKLVGRAFVVHDFEGARIACGYVAPPAEAC